jgi:hypothetical protein
MDAYSQQLQAENTRNLQFADIRAQYDLANQQRKISATGNAVINAGLLVGAAPKAVSAVTAIKSAFTAPSAIKESVANMADNLKSTQDVVGMGNRVDNLTTLLRTNPRVNVAWANYKNLSAQGNENALGNFNLEVNQITGKPLDIQSPHELFLADRIRNTVRDYDSFNRSNRGLSGVDAESEADSAQARLIDIVKARGNLIQRVGVKGAEQYDADNSLIGRATNSLTRLGQRVKSGMEDISQQLGTEGRSAITAIRDVAQESREGVSDFVGSVRNFGSSVVDRMRGYAEVEDSPQRLGGFFTSREDMMANLLGNRNIGRAGVEDEFTQMRPLLHGEPEEGEVVGHFGTYNPEEAMAAAQNARAPLSGSVPDVNAGTAPAGTASTSGNTSLAAEAPVGETASASVPASRVSGTPSTTSDVAGRTTTTSASEAPEATSAAQAAPAQAETAVAATATEAGEEAGAAGAGLLGGGLGEVLSLLGGPLALIGAVTGIGFSIAQAATPQAEAPTPPQTTQPTFNPISAAMPASSSHF